MLSAESVKKPCEWGDDEVRWCWCLEIFICINLGLQPLQLYRELKTLFSTYIRSDFFNLTHGPIMNHEWVKMIKTVVHQQPAQGSELHAVHS